MDSLCTYRPICDSDCVVLDGLVQYDPVVTATTHLRGPFRAFESFARTVIKLFFATVELFRPATVQAARVLDTPHLGLAILRQLLLITHHSLMLLFNIHQSTRQSGPSFSHRRYFKGFLEVLLPLHREVVQVNGPALLVSRSHYFQLIRRQPGTFSTFLMANSISSLRQALSCACRMLCSDPCLPSKSLVRMAIFSSRRRLLRNPPSLGPSPRLAFRLPSCLHSPINGRRLHSLSSFPLFVVPP